MVCGFCAILDINVSIISWVFQTTGQQLLGKVYKQKKNPKRGPCVLWSCSVLFLSTFDFEYFSLSWSQTFDVKKKLIPTIYM